MLLLQIFAERKLSTLEWNPKKLSRLLRTARTPANSKRSPEESIRQFLWQEIRPPDSTTATGSICRSCRLKMLRGTTPAPHCPPRPMRRSTSWFRKLLRRVKNSSSPKKWGRRTTSTRHSDPCLRIPLSTRCSWTPFTGRRPFRWSGTLFCFTRISTLGTRCQKIALMTWNQLTWALKRHRFQNKRHPAFGQLIFHLPPWPRVADTFLGLSRTAVRTSYLGLSMKVSQALFRLRKINLSLSFNALLQLAGSSIPLLVAARMKDCLWKVLSETLATNSTKRMKNLPFRRMGNWRKTSGDPRPPVTRSRTSSGVLFLLRFFRHLFPSSPSIPATTQLLTCPHTLWIL